MSVQDGVADVLIVGAGASGAAVAWSLSQAGLSVVCLEQGGWVDPQSYPHTRPDWEHHRDTDFATDPNVRQRPEDYPINVDRTPIVPLMFNAVGGSTIHWSGHFPRFHPSDFCVHSLDGVADDWPLTYWDLEPYYEQNDAMIGVTGLNGDPANPPRQPRQSPPLGLDRAGEVYVRGLEKLGWHWWPSDCALITVPHGDGRSVCNNCGPCDMGCPIGAMSSAHVTYWPAALDQGVRLVTHARVREITVDAVVVLAGNGVGTPRLLLNSTSPRFPNGLANNSGLVGRNLMFHPVAFVSGVFPERINGYRGPDGLLIHCQEFYETDRSRGFVRGLQLQFARDVGPLGTALGSFTGQLLPWGADHHRTWRERFGHALTVAVMVEDLPELHNRVTLDPVLRDGHGIAAPRVEYTLSENSRRALDFGVARATEVFEAAGAHTVFTQSPLRNSGWHLMGTARMGDDPQDSVTDRWGRTHDVPNLLIVDGSLFVTCAPINPTSTIQALALRTADWLANNFSEVAS